MKRILAVILVALLALTAVGCSLLGNDNQSADPKYHCDENGNYYKFLLQFKEHGNDLEVAEGDAYPHSTIDGSLICEWEIPMYGNTVYESVAKYFENSADSITFRLSQHKFYMFHECVLADGSVYNLETVYVAADGKYANCANYQTILGDDEIAGTEDDLKILTLVYEGWLY